MKRIIVGIEDELAERLESVAPARSRQRSEFIQMAIRKAIWELEERTTADAYRRIPEQAGEVYVEPTVWEGDTRARPRRRKK